MTDASLFAALAADQHLAALGREARPAFLFSADGSRLIWINEAGAALLGTEVAAVADGDVPKTLAWLAPQIVRIASGLGSSGAPRLERIRFPGLAQLDAAACACRRFDGPGGVSGILVAMMTEPRTLRRPSPSAPPPLPGFEPTPGEAPPAARPGWTWVPVEAEAAPAPPARRTTPLRFVFQTDGQGRFTSVSRELAAVIGPIAGEWIGRHFAELAPRLGAEPDGALARAFAGTETFTGLSFVWHDGVSAETSRIEISGLPMFDRDRSFRGFRGFGVCRPPEPAVEPAAAASAAEPSAAPPAARPPSIAAVPPPPPTEPEPEPTPPTEPEPSAPADPPPAAPVIDLSQVRDTKAPPDGKVVRLPTRATPPERPALSPSERNAFREIARALGARVEGESEAAPAPPVPHAEPSEGPAAPHAEPPDAPALPAAGLAGGATEADWAAELAGDPAADTVERVRRSLAPPEPEGPAGLPLGVVDRLPVGIAVARGEQVLFANRTLLDLVGREDVDALARAGGLGALFAGRGLAGGEGGPVLMATADGTTVPVEARMQSIAWEGETALLITVRRALSHDASERLKAAEAIAAVATRRADELQAVLDTATDGVVILDGEGRIIGLNRSAEALFGYEADEVKGKGILMLFAPESHRAAFDYLDSLKSNGVASVLNDGREVTGRVRQGGPVPLFMTIGRLGEAENDRFCAVMRDMTSFKRAESELVSAREQAEQASSQKSDFLAKVSHEIRTPLSAIIGFAEVMMDERFGPLGNDRYRAYARDIHTSGGHVISLINDLLDLSKIEAGKLDLTFTSVSLNDVVQQSVAIMQPQANRDRIIIRTALAANLPNVVADGRSIRQIALNLLSNSIKFTMPGGQVIVSTSLSEGGEAVLRVRDTGIGMTDAELTVAMEPFRQVSTSSSMAGTGLGLPLTKALVEANRASFSIQSVKNSGTIVEVVFPPTRVLAE